jgi:hypothetical protein
MVSLTLVFRKEEVNVGAISSTKLEKRIREEGRWPTTCSQNEYDPLQITKEKLK